MTSPLPPSNPKIRSVLAYGVHAFTATGTVFGFLSLLAVINRDWKQMAIFMALAVFVDGFDGYLARWADTKKYAANVDGALMDNIIDYFTYVVVPALFFYTSDVLPPGWGLPAACIILMTSAYQFSQTNAKTDDYFFVGFPSYWNMAAIYALVLGFASWINLFFVLLFAVLVFIPIKWCYPSRTTYLPRLTFVLTMLFAIFGVAGLILYPAVPDWIVWGSILYIVYYVTISILSASKTKGGILA